MFYSKEREIKVFVDTVDTKQVHPVFEMFYSKEREIKVFVDTVDTKQVHPVFEMFYSKEREIKVFVDTVDTKQVHPVFEMFYSKEREIKVLLTLSIQSRFIRYLKCSTRKREKHERKVIQNKGFVKTVDTSRFIWYSKFICLYS